jgi:uncharacterized protein YndB with AHSA1/START domain
MLVVVAFTAKEYTVSRDITINSSKDTVFQYIKFLKNQENYNHWVMIDPAMKKECRNRDGSVGFVYAWDSQNKKAGKGEQEITKIDEGRRIDIELRFEKPFKGISESSMSTASISPTQTKVTWRFHSKMPYPMNGVMLFMNMDKMLGDQVNGSLKNLKNVLEK